MSKHPFLTANPESAILPRDSEVTANNYFKFLLVSEVKAGNLLISELGLRFLILSVEKESLGTRIKFLYWRSCEKKFRRDGVLLADYSHFSFAGRVMKIE